MIKLLSIVGARPQFIKSFPVSLEIERANKKEKKINEILIHTGQHYDYNMSKIFFDQLGLKDPSYHLGVGSGSHSYQTGEMIKKIEEIIIKERPDFVLVYGDTNSTLAGAIATSKCNIPIIHVESGLRSRNFKMPEEVNRVMTDRISSILFCPTNTAVENLNREGFNNFYYKGFKIEKPKIILSGDVMYDSFLISSKETQPAPIIKELVSSFNNYYLATIHRPENTDSKEILSKLIYSLDKISFETPIIMPIHPRTRDKLKQFDIKYSNLLLIDPVGYFDMIYLISKCKAIFTDSGGLQKEAFFGKKPCITLRNETEWVELVNLGYNTLVGSEPQKILEAENKFINKSFKWKTELYGNGRASEIIVKEISNFI